MESLVPFETLLAAVEGLLAPGTAHTEGFSLRPLLAVLALAVDARGHQSVAVRELALTVAYAYLKSGVLVEDLFHQVVTLVPQIDQAAPIGRVEAQPAQRQLGLPQVVPQHGEHTLPQFGDGPLVAEEKFVSVGQLALDLGVTGHDR